LTEVDERISHAFLRGIFVGTKVNQSVSSILIGKYLLAIVSDWSGLPKNHVKSNSWHTRTLFTPEDFYDRIIHTYKPSITLPEKLAEQKISGNS
jgi:hypothetical protein